MEGSNVSIKWKNKKPPGQAKEKLRSQPRVVKPPNDSQVDSGAGSSSKKLGADANLDDEEKVISPYIPPVQNGFVVFVHQLNVSADSKQKRTSIDWISDALKLLDVVPEAITVELMMEQTANCSSHVMCRDPPVIVYARLQSDSPVVKTGATAATGESRRNLTRQNLNVGSVNQSNNYTSLGKGVTKSTPATASKNVVSNRKTSRIDSKTVHTKSPSTHAQEREKNNLKEAGVSVAVLREKCNQIQSANTHSIWVLLIESRKKCIVNMGKLNVLAHKHRFKVRWIGAQAPKSLDQSVFSVVNDIIQTKSICFPDEFKVTCSTRHKHVKSKANSGACRAGSKHGFRQKALALEVLHCYPDSELVTSSHVSLGSDVVKPDPSVISKSKSLVALALNQEAYEIVDPEVQPSSKVQDTPAPSATTVCEIVYDSIRSPQMAAGGVRQLSSPGSHFPTGKAGCMENTGASTPESISMSEVAKIESNSLAVVSMDLESLSENETTPSITAAELGSTLILETVDEINDQQKEDSQMNLKSDLE